MESLDVVALCHHLDRILDHVQVVRTWSLQSAELPAAERADLLVHLTHLEHAAQDLLRISQTVERPPSLPEYP